MKLYIVQHAKALSKEEDPSRPISIEGREETEILACFIRLHISIQISNIYCSTKKRSFETAEIFNQFIKPEHGINKIEGLSPNDDVQAFINSVKDDKNDLMIISHKPFVDKLISQLVSGNDIELVDICNSSVVCLNKDNGHWLVEWILRPDIIE